MWRTVSTTTSTFKYQFLRLFDEGSPHIPNDQKMRELNTLGNDGWSAIFTTGKGILLMKETCVKKTGV